MTKKSRKYKTWEKWYRRDGNNMEEEGGGERVERGVEVCMTGRGRQLHGLGVREDSDGKMKQ